MVAHTIQERLLRTKLDLWIAGGGACSFGTGVGLSEREILFSLVRTNPIDPNCRSRGHSADFLKSRKRFRHAAEETKPDPTGWPRVPGNLAAAQKRFDLG